MNTQEIRDRLGRRQVVFGIGDYQAAHSSMEQFKRLVDIAASSGATHILVGNLPYRCDSWVLPDHEDPYASWCNSTTAILRFCPPEEIQPWVSAEHAAACQDFLGKQLEIMRPYGLKGACGTTEPLWLPESVYRKHPHWRGAQCELGRIASRPYFAPSIDEPEVLDLYRRAMKQFSSLFPEVDSFNILSNDSGAGLAWTLCIYPGMNGPAKYRQRDGGERVAHWMKTLRQGASEGGADVRFNIYSSGFPPELKASIREKLPSGLFISGQNSVGEVWDGPSAAFGGGLWCPTYPVVGLGNPVAFLSGLQSIYNNPDNVADRATVFFGPADLDVGELLIRGYFRHPEPGLRHHTEALLDAAASFCGDPSSSEELISVWQRVAQAVHATLQVRQKGFGLIFNYGTVSMRWLLRPLVPQPEKLGIEETAYYRDFVFAVGTGKDNPDLGMILGKSCFNGESVTWMTRWCLQEAIGTLRGAQSNLEGLAQKLPGEGAGRVRLLAAQIGALACLAVNARNCVMYKYALDTASQPMYGPNQADYDDNILYDQRALSLRKIAREELDNTYELIRLMEKAHGPVLDHASSPEEESVFLLGPNLIGALQRKAEVMLDHWQDYEALYPATKVRDFDPEPVGNLVRADG